MKQKTEKIIAKIEKEKSGTGLYMRIASRAVGWPIQEDEVMAIMNMKACSDYLENKYPMLCYRREGAKKSRNLLKQHREAVELVSGTNRHGLKEKK